MYTGIVEIFTNNPPNNIVGSVIRFENTIAESGLLKAELQTYPNPVATWAKSIRMRYHLKKCSFGSFSPIPQ